MLSLYYHEFMGKIEKKMMFDDFMLDKVSNEIKIIVNIENFDDTKISIETDDKLPGDLTLKTVLILITCFIKDADKFNPKIFLEEVLVV